MVTNDGMVSYYLMDGSQIISLSFHIISMQFEIIGY